MSQSVTIFSIHYGRQGFEQMHKCADFLVLLKAFDFFFLLLSERKFVPWYQSRMIFPHPVYYHNLPIINGKSQLPGAGYGALETKFDSKRSVFSTNIARAYGADANVERWLRSYTLRGGTLEIEDTFTINGAETPNIVNFMTWGKVDISKLGVVILEAEGKQVALKYDAKRFTPSMVTIKPVREEWGSEVYRVSLTAVKVVDKGKYTFVINKV